MKHPQRPLGSTENQLCWAEPSTPPWMRRTTHTREANTQGLGQPLLVWHITSFLEEEEEEERDATGDEEGDVAAASVSGEGGGGAPLEAGPLWCWAGESSSWVAKAW
eukprot:GGOE01035885.1.p3 GENE.GGOE01035885.1~~GGOE01035885.1.p3  ORF type:complete len:107 (+),score=11.94 GGOE01035885.1:146-466(+)